MKTLRVLAIAVVACTLLVGYSVAGDVVSEYENVWCYDIEAIKKRFPNNWEEQKLSAVATHSGFKQFEQKNPSKEIVSRTFTFLYNAVYQIDVQYSNKKAYKKALGGISYMNFEIEINPKKTYRYGHYVRTRASNSKMSISYLGRGCQKNERWVENHALDEKYRTEKYGVMNLGAFLSDILKRGAQTVVIKGIEYGLNPWTLTVDNIKQMYSDLKEVEATNKWGGIKEYVASVDTIKYHPLNPEYHTYRSKDRAKDGIRFFEGVRFTFLNGKLWRIKAEMNDAWRIAISPLFSDGSRMKNVNENLRIEGVTNDENSYDSRTNIKMWRYVILVNPAVEKQVYASQGLMWPAYGYDKVEWGADIQTVASAYPGLNEIFQADTSFGRRHFVQHGNSGSVIARDFIFYRNRLIGVAVNYADVGTKTLVDMLISTYGENLSERVYVEIEDKSQFDLTKAAASYADYQTEADYRYELKKKGYVETPQEGRDALKNELDVMENFFNAIASAKIFSRIAYTDVQAASTMMKEIDAQKKQRQAVQKKQAEDEKQKRIDNLGK